MLIDANLMSNVQMFQCSNVPIFNVPMFKCSNVPMFHWTTGPLVHWLNVKCDMSNVKCHMSNVKCQMSNVKYQMSIKLTFFSERTSGVPPVIFRQVEQQFLIVDTTYTATTSTVSSGIR